MANVLVLGGGGREHAITHKLVQSPQVESLFVSPGNVGISVLPKTRCIRLKLDDPQAVYAFCLDAEICLVVIGPEKYLDSELTNVLSARGIHCFGPSKECAVIETNKCIAKNLMVQLGIPTARFQNFIDVDAATAHIRSCDYNAWVVKASGLASGKGVHIANSVENACVAVEDFISKRIHGDAGTEIVVEELLKGDEASALCFTDGTTVEMMPLVQDYKRLFPGSRGPNTGGMGAYCPFRKLTQDEITYVKEKIIEKILKYFKDQGKTYKGVLYVGLMKTDTSLYVLEFNCRFGDPETEVLMPLLQSDLYEVMESCVNGNLADCGVSWRHDRCAVGVVLASEGYPSAFQTGYPIQGLQEAANLAPDAVVYHCGTKQDDEGNIVTNGGRVLCIVGIGYNPAAAKLNAYSALLCIGFHGCTYRRDIGSSASGWGSLYGSFANLTEVYQESGVNLSMAQEAVKVIHPWSLTTARPGAYVSDFGDFGCTFDSEIAGYTKPIIVSSTDGVGTKLRISIEGKNYETIGIDLVAMSVNDILTKNAEPLFFLDYISMNKLDLVVIEGLMKGIADGCTQAKCSLIGGETAEMSDLYSEGDFDIAGFAVGALEKGRDVLLPMLYEIIPGDVILALPSSGLHSNGYTMMRRIIEVRNLTYDGPCPWNPRIKLGTALLTPTRIYVNALLPILRSGKVKAAVHVTGGGLKDNIPRVLPDNVYASLDACSWPIHDEFLWLSSVADVSPEEMVNVFNCGLGMLLIVGADDLPHVEEALVKKNEKYYQIGSIQALDENYELGPQVRISNLLSAFSKATDMPVDHCYLKKSVRKRVAVLISGQGSNMLALVNYGKRHFCTYSVVLVISNEEDAPGLLKAASCSIPTKCIPSNGKRTEEFEDAVNNCLLENQVDIVCLAGFMRILSKTFVSKWLGRMVNVHPSLLPSFKGLNPHKQALEAGVRVSGATVHFVEECVDSGGIILQSAVPVYPDDSESVLRRRVKQAEHKMYPKVVERLANGSIIRQEDGTVQWMNAKF